MNGGGQMMQGGNGGGDSPRHIRMYHPRHSPHPRQRGLDPSRSFTPEGLSPDQPPPLITIQQQQQQLQQQQQQQNQQGIPRGASATPTMQQRIKALGVATPLAMSSPVRRSNPGTPTQPRRPDFIGVNMVGQQQQQQQPGATYYDFPLQPQQQQAQLHQTGLPPVHPYHQQQQQAQSQYPMVHHNGGLPQQQQQSQQRTPNVVYHHGSPQRRYLSEGELARQGAELSYARSNQTVDNIRELAGSPQRGVYMWKDISPGFSSNDGSNQAQQLLGNPSQPQQPQQSPGVFVSMSQSVYQNTPSPTATQQQQQQPQYGGVSAARYQLQQQQQQATMNSYHPALRGGVPVFPPQPLPPTAVSLANSQPQQQQQQSAQVLGPQAPSPQIKRKATPTRPMSFVRALEMTDSMELNAATDSSGNGGGGSNGTTGGGGVQSAGGRATTPTPPDRGSVYDMNYEISV